MKVDDRKAKKKPPRDKSGWMNYKIDTPRDKRPRDLPGQKIFWEETDEEVPPSEAE